MDGKRFPIFSYIAFTIRNKKTGFSDSVICRIIGMEDSECKRNNGYIIADNVEINKCESNQYMFYFRDMTDVNYAYCD